MEILSTDAVVVPEALIAKFVDVDGDRRNIECHPTVENVSLETVPPILNVNAPAEMLEIYI
jgi:hypothetical protein